jgi:hypothetical protein
MNVPAALLDAFPASAARLLGVARRQVDDGMLAEIARADYGRDAERHLAALVPIRDHGWVPAPLHWHPGEVLELVRWSQPEDPTWKPGGTGTRGHQMRAFACAALLRASAEPGNEYYEGSDDSTLAQCLASAKVLGEEMLEAAGQFLTWRIPRMTVDHPERLVFPVGLLLIATCLRGGRLEEHVLGEAAEWVLAEEAAGRRADGHHSGRAEPCPLADLFSWQEGMWQPHAAELLRQAEVLTGEGPRKRLRLVGGLLLDPR